MLVSKRYGFIFFCMPKNASTSIEVMLRDYSELLFIGLPEFRHMRYTEYEQCIKPYLESKFDESGLESVCIMREPVDWLYSWYRFRSRLELRDSSHPNHKRCTVGISFEEFVEAYISKHPPEYANVGISQFEFLSTAENSIGIDRVFLYENLQSFVDYMEKKIGNSLAFPQHNVSPQNSKGTFFVGLMNKINRFLLERIGIKKGVIKSAVKVERLPKDLLERLKNKIPNDFELYEQLKELQNKR